MSKDVNDYLLYSFSYMDSGTSVNTPFDVVKSRLQNRIATSAGKTFPTLVEVYREGGIRACYKVFCCCVVVVLSNICDFPPKKGYAARMLRLGPGGGVMLVAFDYIMSLLQ